MTGRTINRRGASQNRRQPNHWDYRNPSALGRSRRAAATQESPDFSLIHDVQIRATGANIHAVAQQLQIYVSAIECGAMLEAQAAESQLRAFLASGR